jgi:hypothetical protein
MEEEKNGMELSSVIQFISDTCSPILFAGARASYRDKFINASLASPETQLALSKFVQDGETPVSPLPPQRLDSVSISLQLHLLIRSFTLFKAYSGFREVPCCLLCCCLILCNKSF